MNEFRFSLRSIFGFTICIAVTAWYLLNLSTLSCGCLFAVVSSVTALSNRKTRPVLRAGIAGAILAAFLVIVPVLSHVLGVQPLPATRFAEEIDIGGELIFRVLLLVLYVPSGFLLAVLFSAALTHFLRRLSDSPADSSGEVVNESPDHVE